MIGHLLITDITGYTGYLRESELEHADGILADLLNLLVDHASPPLVLSRLEGDAVVSYAPDGSFLSGQTFVERMERCYVAFRRALELMALNTTCSCNACANIGGLDLKFFVHHGEFLVQELTDHRELLGSDVNLLHRLVKNEVKEATGVVAYTLYTEPAIASLGIDTGETGWTAHTEEVADFGSVPVWIQDLAPVWADERERHAAVHATQRVLIEFAADVALPPQVVWDYVVDPEFRQFVTGADRHEIEGRVGGRLDEGSVFQCYHGDAVIPQVVVEWQPFERLVTRELTPVPGGSTFVHRDIVLEPAGEGTRIRELIADPEGPFYGRLMLRLTAGRWREEFQGNLDAFRDVIEADHAGRVTANAAQSGRQSPDRES